MLKKSIFLKHIHAVSQLALRAKVSSQIINPLGLVRKKFEGTTNSIGQVSYLWKVGAGVMLGTFQVNAQLSAPGYENNSAQTTFVVQRR